MEQRESIKDYSSFFFDFLLSLYRCSSQPFPIRNVRRVSLFFGHTTNPTNHGHDREYVYIFIYSFFAKEQGGLSAPSPSYISSPPLPLPETSEVCTRGNRRFRRRAELDDRRACTRSCCSSDTDSRCRLHWSRLTGRDYYKGGMYAFIPAKG